MQILDGLDKDAFANEFLNAYLADGFTTMTKREIDLLILKLIVKHRDGWSWDNPPTAFEMAQNLRAKRSRLRSMMDELSFRDLADVNEAAKRLRRVIEDRIREDGEKIFDDDKVRIQIEDGFLREYAKDLVQKDYGIVDSSFNSAIIVLSGDKFLALVFEILPKAAREKIEEELDKHRKDLNGAANQKLFRIFIEQAVKGAGSEVGKQAVTLGFTALAGGLEKLPALVQWFIKRLKKDEAGDDAQDDDLEV